MDLARRDDWEEELARVTGRALRKQYANVRRALGSNPSLDKLTPAMFEAMRAGLQAAIRPVLERVYLAHAEALTHEFPRTKQGLGIDWGVINERAATWSSKYSFDLVTGITNTTRNTLQAQISDFFRDARTLKDLENTLSNLFGPVRAAMIAQTEVTRAASAAEEAYAEELRRLGLKVTFRWETNADERVCPICEPRNGTLQGDGWQEPPPAHPRCILPGNEVIIPGALVGGAKSFYDGRGIEFGFSDGRNIAVTMNHPILTNQGWIAAKLLGEGDYVLSTSNAQGIASTINPNDDHRPTVIEQVFSSLEESSEMFSVSVPSSPVDFYGDGGSINGDVKIVNMNSFLLSNNEVEIAQPICKHSFSRDDPALLSLPADSVRDFLTDGNLFPTSRGMGFVEQGRSFSRGGVFPPDNHALRNAAWSDTAFQKALSESPAIDTRLAREFVLRFTSEIALDQIVEVRNFDFSGHVYDLQVDDYELYICNGVIVKNCRCWVNAVVLNA